MLITTLVLTLVGLARRRLRSRATVNDVERERKSLRERTRQLASRPVVLVGATGALGTLVAAGAVVTC